jgi:hypothetical protein
MDKKIIEMVGEYTWRIPCKDNEHAGFEVTINSGKPTGNPDAEEVCNTGSNKGLEDAFVEFRGYDSSTGWESKWKCSLESFIKVFATRCGGTTTVKGEEVEQF